MASARKKLDEKNLKILRELVSLPENKHCFDCHQRGPTYVNVTIGSFICTTCSGLLRGLTPPHRVKSISMATFTSDEIDLLRCKGNEYCRKVWLGLYDGEQVAKNEQQVKEFMIAKYERKRYYIKPSDSEKVSKGISTNSSSLHVQNIHRLPSSSNVSFPSHNVNNNVNRNHNNNLFSSQQTFVKPKEAVKVPDQDPFNSNNLNVSASLPTDNFANFDNNPIFNSGSLGVTGNSSTLHHPHIDSKSQPPSEDRYAALKDLDSMMKSQTQQSSETSSTSSMSAVEWDSGNIWSSSSGFSQSSAFDAPLKNNKDSNPFSVGNSEGNWANNSVGNPFNADFAWASANGQIISTGLQSSQSLHFNSNKHWNLRVTPNPFTVSSNGQSVNHHSSNPFL